MSRYDDIINLPHYEPKYHTRMSMASRAAQFAPFAALTVHDSAIQETARLTDEFSLGETEIDELNRKMQLIAKHLDEEIELEVTYFLPDKKKKGGSYEHYTGTIRRIDEYEGVLIFADGKRIPLNSLQNIEIYY